MNKIIGYVLLSFTISMLACNDEHKLSPSEGDIYGYFVPQGEHDYDDKIVDWKNRYNIFALYKWSPRDLYWSPTKWNEAQEDTDANAYPWVAGYYGEQADEEYVGQQLDLIEKLFLSFYPDSTLQRCLPLKMLLCKELEQVDRAGERWDVNIFSSFDLLAFNWGSERILSLSPEEKTEIRLDINLTFLARLNSNAKIPLSTEFYSYSDYGSDMSRYNYYERGFVMSDNNDKTNSDWQHYLEAILSTSYDDLTREVDEDDDSFHGILNDRKDTYGLIKKKYTAIINHFKSYGIDLQRIGDAAIN